MISSSSLVTETDSNESILPHQQGCSAVIPVFLKKERKKGDKQLQRHPYNMPTTLRTPQPKIAKSILQRWGVQGRQEPSFTRWL